MNEYQQSLYDRILDFTFEVGDEELTFSQRLARENGWTDDYTDRAIDEYKRFVFLAMVAGHPVTPSDQVDQVWHLHLTYTRSYWDQLCQKVLNKSLHHGPTKGGSEEAKKFDQWYLNTLESYQRFFGHAPPSDVWPDASIRFGRDLHFRRINTKRNWVIRKPRILESKKYLLPGLLTVLILIAAIIAIGDLFGGDNSPNTAATAGSSSPSNHYQAGMSLLARVNVWTVVFGTALVFFIVVVPIIRLFKRCCPRCNAWFSLKRTGAVEKTEWFKGDRVECKCKKCESIVWISKLPPWLPGRSRGSGGGGGGCGGCGGCGGGGCGGGGCGGGGCGGG